MNSLRERIAVARGEKKADIVLKNGQFINVFTGDIYPADIALQKEHIAGIGDYSGEEEIDLNGRYITPGFIDAHLHLESTMLTPGELARAVIPQGTTLVVCDPHEIANVLGASGVKYLLATSKGLPLDFFFSVPSCVPASDLETSGARLSTESILSLLKDERVINLGEMMNFPGVLAGKKDVLDKIEAACDVGVEGHAPGLSGKDLNAYVAAGMSSDHESVTLEEAREKLKLGMHIMVREGSSAKNLEAILPLIKPSNARYFSFCTDDIYPSDLAEGHMNRIIKKAVALKLDPAIAVQLATINPARYYNLKHYGAVAPGYFADLNVVSNLEDFNVEMVFKKGKLVSSRKKTLFEIKPKKIKEVRETIKIKPFEPEALEVKAKSEYARAIEIIPGQILTKSIMVTVKKKNGDLVSDPDSDVLRLAVVERHKGSGNIGLGVVKGFGLKRGAMATSVAHDSHNIICVGVDDEDMISAVRRVARLGGGMAVVKGGLVLAELALPIAGLISDEPLGEVIEKLKKLDKMAEELGCRIDHPFGILSFLSLPVIPELRLTDKGLVDVEKFKIVDLFE
jgi:adenine deaminase